ncbi:DNA polymerase III subunit gamma and tau [Streptomyces sp. NPDC058001]|uniref:DNA polymerase III subunit gamma and tau n=1 Tax=Streptomyces sp. NPDC058001 TaxID=3346300 RepID=UPI0036E72747
MSSLALYRRYRPESFAEVIGQEHVTDPLQQALRNNRVNHAYLFSGPRGCGKTTSARILARCLNCEQGPTPTPCGECQSCRDLARNGPGSIDVIEIDAASHGGVDDARDLREKAFFGPASSRYKIYIIDEAHMVTSAGFNALLKVVEEPPEHLKFIFATTEPEKVIGTIRSRTHHYPFRLVPPGTLRDYLAEVCGKEDIPVADGVLPLVVRSGAGSVRDSMSVMDQLLAAAREEGVTYAMATSLLGYTDGSLLDSVVDAFATGDGAAAFEVVDRVIEGGNDPRRFVADLLERLRDLVILSAVPDAADKGLIDAPADVIERMSAQAGAFGGAELSRAADLVNEGLTEMRGATSPRLQLELICARVLLPAAYEDERSLLARLDRLERGGHFTPGGGAPAMGYVPGPGAHAPVAPAMPPPPSMPVPPVAQADPGSGTGMGASTSMGTGAGGAGTPPAPVQPTAPEPTAPATPERRPGGWPTAVTAGAGRPASTAPQAAPAAASTPSSPSSPSTTAPAPAQQPPAPPSPPAQGGLDPRTLWPNILEAVKNRRRFTWILLSQNAQVAGFDGTTLQLGFVNAGARDNFGGSGSEEVLRQALREQFGLDWKVEAIVDPSGGSAPPPAAANFGGAPTGPGYGGPGAGSAGSGGAAGTGGTGSGFGSAQTAPRPTSYQQSPGASQPPAPHQQHGSAPTDRPATATPRTPPPTDRTPEPPRAVAPEDDIPEDDDPDLDESALSGHDLIVRELGATIVEEFTNE